MASTPPAYQQFGRALAFAERTLTESLRRRLAERGTTLGAWYVLSLVATDGPRLDRDTLLALLGGSRNLDGSSAPELLARLATDGLSTDGALVDLTEAGYRRYQELRDDIAADTVELLDQFDLADVTTTVRTLQAITAQVDASTSVQPRLAGGGDGQ